MIRAVSQKRARDWLASSTATPLNSGSKTLCHTPTSLRSVIAASRSCLNAAREKR
jgi:hypothetical protein